MISLFILKQNTRGTRYGIGTYLQQLTATLIANKDISIYIINYLSESYREFTVETTKSKIVEIHIPFPLSRIKGEQQGQRYAARVVNLLTPFIEKCHNPVFQVNYPDTLPIVKYLKTRFDSKIISVIHSAQWQFAFDGNKNKFNEVWLNRKEENLTIVKSIETEKELYQISDKIVSVTRYMKDFIVQYFDIPEEKIEVVPNGISSSIIHRISKEERASIKQNLGFTEDEKIILFSGRLDKGKGLYFLLDAYADVVMQYNNIRLVLVGEDSGPDKISQYLIYCKNFWSKVTFTGFVDYDTMQKFYQIADIGIVPSVYDHCPYVVLEMIVHNIPLILSDTEGLNEILTEDHCIYIKPAVDNDGNIAFSKNEIADAIFTMLKNDKSIIETITSGNQELLKSRFSSDRMGGEMYSLLLNLHEKEVKNCFENQ